MNIPVFAPRAICCPNCGEAKDFIVRSQAVNRLDPATPLQAVTCGKCGLCFLNPQYPPQAYDYFYSYHYFEDLKGSYHADSAKLAHAYRASLGDIFREFSSSLEADGLYADIGAGTGSWLDMFKDSRPDFTHDRIIVVEPSRLACDDLAARYPGLRVECSMLENNKLRVGSLTGILCSALIEHFTDPLLALLHFNTLLRPGGKLLMLTPALNRAAFVRGALRTFKFVHTFYYTPGTLAALAAKAGFAPKRVEVIAARLDSPLWFPVLAGIYEKTAERLPEQVESLRRPSPYDMAGREEAEHLFRGLRGAFYREAMVRRARSAIRKLIKRDR
jgi:SAM-dependent methyltransferase